MAAYWVWWIAAMMLIAAELVTGTFYLLAIGVAAVMGGVAATFAVGLAAQFLVAGATGLTLVFTAYRWRQTRAALPAQVSLDVGAAVRVEQWLDDGTARVYHRGSTWNAELETATTPRSDSLYVVATRGSTLVLANHRPDAAP